MRELRQHRDGFDVIDGALFLDAPIDLRIRQLKFQAYPPVSVWKVLGTVVVVYFLLTAALVLLS